MRRKLLLTLEIVGDASLYRDGIRTSPSPIRRVRQTNHSLVTGGPFGFAGIWDAWKDAEGRWLESFAILTTEPNEIMAPIHNRMSVSRCSILRETLES